MDSKKIDRAIKLIQSGAEMAAKVNQPIEVAYSGGKDSDVILELTRMAGVNYRAIYKNTTIDPPGTIAHAIAQGAEIRRPEKSFLEILSTRGYPNRYMRFCCSSLKEYHILDYAVLGIRREESQKRAKRYKEPEQCRVYRKGVKTRQYFPILDWTLQDVADFVTDRKIQLAPTYYDENGNIDFSRRLGCMCCPLASYNKRIAEFHKYPGMVKLYIRGGMELCRRPNNRHTYDRFGDDPFKMFVCDVFCDNSRVIFEDRFGKNLFDDGIDCKKFLEDQFKIKFNNI